MRRKRGEPDRGSWLDFILGLLGLFFLYLLSLYYTNRPAFWRDSVYGVIAVALACSGVVWWQRFRSKQREDRLHRLIEELRARGLEEALKNFIDMFALRQARSKKNGWSFRNYLFEWDRIDDLEKNLVNNGIHLRTEEGKRDIFDLLRHYIQAKEEKLTVESIKAIPRDFNALSGADFEKLLMKLYTALGYAVELVGRTGDQGGDLIANKDGLRLLIQAKCYHKESVGNGAIQEAVAARTYYKCNKAAVITNSYFTPEAITLAAPNSVELIPGERLQQMLLDAFKEHWN